MGTEQSILTICNEVPVAFGRSLRLRETSVFGSRTVAMTVLFGRVRMVASIPWPMPSTYSHLAVVLDWEKGRFTPVWPCNKGDFGHDIGFHPNIVAY